MKTLRMLALLLIGALLLPALSSCVNMDARPSSHEHEYGEWIVIQDPTTETTGLRERKCHCGKTETEVMEVLRREIQIFTNGYFAPFCYYEEGSLTGIEAELAELIAQRMNCDLSLEDVDFESIVHRVADVYNDGIIHIGLASMTVTDGRLETVDFTNTYLTHRMVLVSQSGQFETVDDFRARSGLIVGAVTDTAEQIYGEYDAEQVGNTFYHCESYADAINQLARGNLNCLILPEEILEHFYLSSYGFSVVDGYYAEESYAIAVPKNNHNLMNRLNTIIADLQNEGAIAHLVEKYYGDWAQR